MALPIGEVVGVNSQALADVLKGQTWGLQIEGKMYDAMFTGTTSGDGVILMKVLRKSRSSQQPQIKTPEE